MSNQETTSPTTTTATESPISPTSPSQKITIKPSSPTDGRRNSQGEILPSPTDTWKPMFGRTQSWSQEDLKRLAYVGEVRAKEFVDINAMEEIREGEGGFGEGKGIMKGERLGSDCQAGFTELHRKK